MHPTFLSGSFNSCLPITHILGFRLVMIEGDRDGVGKAKHIYIYIYTYIHTYIHTYIYINFPCSCTRSFSRPFSFLLSKSLSLSALIFHLFLLTIVLEYVSNI